nr:MAG TPA: holin [Caudoviricetes sp.]
MLFLDFILGVTDAYLLNREQVKSSIATRGVFKKVSKFLLPLIVVIVMKGAGFTNTAPIINSIM